MDLTKEEQQQLTNLLRRLRPSFNLPYEIFVEIARLVVLSIIELVPLRMNQQGEVEVLLLDRGDDPIWPHQLHTPGTVIRPTDEEGKAETVINRIISDELQGTTVGEPYYIGSDIYKNNRGKELAHIFWAEVMGEPKTGEFHAVDSLPANTMQSQIEFINLAVENFRKHKQASPD